MDPNARPHGLCPAQHFAAAVIAALRGESSGDVDDTVGLASQLPQLSGNRRRRGRRRLQQRGKPVEGLVQLLPRHRLRSPVVRQRVQGLPGELQRIRDPGERLRPDDGSVAELPAGVAEGDQVSGQIPAIHGRHVLRLQGPKVTCVVPIVDVAVEALEPAHRRQGRLQPLHGIERAQPAKVAGRHNGQQVEPEVGGRRSMGHDRFWVFLKVVGREMVVLRHDEGIEEAPRAACDQPQRPRIGNRARRWTRQRRWTAGPLRDDRRQHPQDHEWSCDEQSHGLDQRDDARCRRAERHAARHSLVEPADIEGEVEPRLSGGDPLQHVPPRPEETYEGAHDGVAHQPRLMREKGDDEGDLQEREAEILPHGAQVAAFREPQASRHDPGEERQESGQREHGEHPQAPHHRGRGWQSPPHQQGEKRGRRRQRSAQVVHHLPAANERNRLARRIGVRAPPTAEDPGDQLPIAPRPTMLARRRDVVARWELLDDLDVGDEAGARKDPLQKVVTQHRALRNPSGERGFEDVHVIDPLAGVGTLSEQILVHIGDGKGVGIDTAGAGEHTLKQRSLAPGRQRRRHPGLQYRVPLDHALRARIEQRAVEGVRHLADQSPGGSRAAASCRRRA